MVYNKLRKQHEESSVKIITTQLQGGALLMPCPWKATYFDGAPSYFYITNKKPELFS